MIMNQRGKRKRQTEKGTGQGLLTALLKLTALRLTDSHTLTTQLLGIREVKERVPLRGLRGTLLHMSLPLK